MIVATDIIQKESLHMAIFVEHIMKSTWVVAALLAIVVRGISHDGMMRAIQMTNRLQPSINIPVTERVAVVAPHGLQ